MAKQLLAENRALYVPVKKMEVHGTSPYGRQLSASRLAVEAERWELEEVRLESHADQIIPDAVCRRGDFEFYVEFWMTHKVGNAKRQWVCDHKRPMVEVRLRLECARTKNDLAAFISSTPRDREWIWHPKEQAALDAAQTELDGKIAAENARRRRRRALAMPVKHRNAPAKYDMPAKNLTNRPAPVTRWLRCESCRATSSWLAAELTDVEPPCPFCGEPISLQPAL
ncbi:MAG TPA: hypothetical protein VFK24_10370 [Gammaproteobacteria bacterium]|nr:hypothetical protein [Gammaproteobacteria bacterium]